MSVLRRGAIAAAVLAIVLQWVNTRTSILHVNQDPAHPVILDTYAFYHLMAMGLREGRIGQLVTPLRLSLDSRRSLLSNAKER